jgi:signal transduction histidine kinase
LRRIKLPREMNGQEIHLQAIAQDSRGGLWTSFGRHGLYRFANGTWTIGGGLANLPNSGVISEFADAFGRVWFGYTNNQIAMLEGERVQTFGPGENVRIGNVMAIYGRGAAIWIGGDLGLERYDHGEFKTITAIDNNLLRGISGIAEIGTGDLWINGLTGIVHIDPTEYARALKDSSYLVKGERFGGREGLPGTAPQIRPLPTAIVDDRGAVWFGLTRGVVRIDPAIRRYVPPVPPITIQSVTYDGKDYPLRSSINLPAHTSNITINYSAISLSDPEAIRVRYKLKNEDAGWHDSTAGSSATYRNLAPGTYEFLAEVSDRNGTWSGSAAALAFTILPSWYQTAWFRTTCGLASLLLLWIGYRFRVSRLERQFSIALEARVHERTRIARDLHDTLLQSVNALLLRLQTVSNVLPARPEEAKRRLDGAIEQASNAVTEGRDKVSELRSLASTGSSLEQAIADFMRDLLNIPSPDPRPEVLFQVDGRPTPLDPVIRDEVYRIAIEALRNAVTHARPKKIDVDIRYDDHRLRLRIRDDGAGIDPAVLGSNRNSGHWGLRGMRERAKLAGGRLRIWSQVDCGTEIELDVPTRSASARVRRTGGSVLSRFRRRRG